MSHLPSKHINHYTTRTLLSMLTRDTSHFKVRLCCNRTGRSDLLRRDITAQRSGDITKFNADMQFLSTRIKAHSHHYYLRIFLKEEKSARAAGDTRKRTDHLLTKHRRETSRQNCFHPAVIPEITGTLFHLPRISAIIPRSATNCTSGSGHRGKQRPHF
ncbi:hypothetical protein J6590_063726 [Homalodisca vitripennis]|nr:hypothetical protein J6590_063726 [Homalodisca vitripennis]